FFSSALILVGADGACANVALMLISDSTAAQIKTFMTPSSYSLFFENKTRARTEAGVKPLDLSMPRHFSQAAAALRQPVEHTCKDRRIAQVFSRNRGC